MADLSGIEGVLSERIFALCNGQDISRNELEDKTLYLAVRAVALDCRMREVEFGFVRDCLAVAGAGYSFHYRYDTTARLKTEHLTYIAAYCILHWFICQGRSLVNETADAAVAGGMAFLDANLRTGWERRIDIDRLSIDNSAWCMLGQLHGGFRSGVRALSLTNAELMQFGFVETSTVSCAKLTLAWKRALRQRMAA